MRCCSVGSGGSGCEGGTRALGRTIPLASVVMDTSAAEGTLVSMEVRLLSPPAASLGSLGADH